MSQNNTMVPGMADNFNAGNAGMYSRPNTQSTFSGGATATRGTIVPGMSMQNGAPQAPIETQTVTTAQSAGTSGQPVIGFLYSISNQGKPEYWPIMIGYNRIGRNEDNEIILREQTVSGLHASIMVQKKRANGEVVSVIRLEQGKTGVLVNGEEVDLRYGSECKNGDIITIGSNYTFVLILITAEAIGLAPAPGFIATENEAEATLSDNLPPMNNSFNPYNASNRGTMALDGSTSMENAGGTRFM